MVTTQSQHYRSSSLRASEGYVEPVVALTRFFSAYFNMGAATQSYVR